MEGSVQRLGVEALELSETMTLVSAVVRGAAAGLGQEVLFSVFAETVLLRLAIVANGVIII